MIPFWSIAIIWYGDFWKLLVDIISNSDQKIRIGVISRRENKYAIGWEELSSFEVVVSCVPIAMLSQSYMQIARYISDTALVRDVCSIKEQPLQWMKHSWIHNYIATHPMFWPYSYEKKWKSLAGLRLVVTWYTCQNVLFASRQHWFEYLWLIVIVMSEKEHDKYLAKTLFLTHYIAQIVHHAWFDRTNIDTASFGFLMDAVESVKNDQKLFLDVWRFNPYCQKIIDKFLKSQNKIHQLLWF